MTITHYLFGHIQIDGQEFDKDVIVYGDHVGSPWWRQEGHELFISDLSDILEEKSEVLLIGTGYYGRMKVSEEVLDKLRGQGIEPHVYTTQLAIDEFNRLETQHKHVAAALHLTC